MKVLSEQFRAIALNHDAKERDVHAFLKQYPYVLIHLFNGAWNLYRIFPEFRLGADFRADFVIISAGSGSWYGHFIELKGPQDAPYTKAGLPTRQLNWAIGQTNDWLEFVWSQRANLMREFAKLIKPFGRHAQNNLMARDVTADIELEHPRTHIDFAYYIVIGNSALFSEKQRKAHARYSVSQSVVTYDRVYKTMREIESHHDTLERQIECLSRCGDRAFHDQSMTRTAKRPGMDKL
ncbi:MAG: DUF4263 domain-containing protein [Candidatus Sumerlaeota bacterium]|nr:DUF4263 domain-containing protein [Candidatus Sumerlaeota bacterium]